MAALDNAELNHNSESAALPKITISICVPQEFADDVRQHWTNVKLYNPVGDPFRKVGEKVCLSCWSLMRTHSHTHTHSYRT